MYNQIYPVSTNSGTIDVCILGHFDPTSCFADIYDLQDFLGANEMRLITPNKGCIAAILINGWMANVNVVNWQCGNDWADNFVCLSLRDLEQIEQHGERVQVVWYYGR